MVAWASWGQNRWMRNGVADRATSERVAGIGRAVAVERDVDTACDLLESLLAGRCAQELSPPTR